LLNGLFIVQSADNAGGKGDFRVFAALVTAVAGYDFIAGLAVRAYNRGLCYAMRPDTGNKGQVCWC
jgi:hypothetical protein